MNKTPPKYYFIEKGKKLGPVAILYLEKLFICGDINFDTVLIPPTGKAENWKIVRAKYSENIKNQINSTKDTKEYLHDHLIKLHKSKIFTDEEFKNIERNLPVVVAKHSSLKRDIFPIHCDSCKIFPIGGKCFKCTKPSCENIHFCEACNESNKTKLYHKHKFERFYNLMECMVCSDEKKKTEFKKLSCGCDFFCTDCLRTNCTNKIEEMSFPILVIQIFIHF
jgi:hypothetical protein